MNETTMTLIGNVVDAPTLRRTRNGHLVANFRLASTARRFDREQGQWIDSGTLFVTVTAWRAMAQNVADSLRKGQPAVVTGRYYQREFTQGEVLRTTYELEATAVGHDLARGISSFERVTRPALSTPIETDDEGRPLDQTSEYLDLAHDAGFATHGEAVGEPGAELAPGVDIDPLTGEIRDLVRA